MPTAVDSFSRLKWLDRVSRLLVGGLFLYTSAINATRFDFSVDIVAAYGLLPDFAVLMVTILLIAFGLIAGVMVLIGKREGLLLSLFLLLTVSLAAGYGVAVGLDIDCGCLPEKDPKFIAFSTLRTDLVRYLILAIPLGGSYWFTLKKKKLENYQ